MSIFSEQKAFLGIENSQRKSFWMRREQQAIDVKSGSFKLLVITFLMNENQQSLDFWTPRREDIQVAEEAVIVWAIKKDLCKFMTPAHIKKASFPGIKQ